MTRSLPADGRTAIGELIVNLSASRLDRRSAEEASEANKSNNNEKYFVRNAEAKSVAAEEEEAATKDGGREEEEEERDGDATAVAAAAEEEGGDDEENTECGNGENNEAGRGMEGKRISKAGSRLVAAEAIEDEVSDSEIDVDGRLVGVDADADVDAGTSERTTPALVRNLLVNPLARLSI